MKKALSVAVAVVLSISSCTTFRSSSEIIPKSKRTFSGSYERIFDCAVSSVMDMNWQIIYSNKEEGIIQAKVPMTIWTWGDLVTIHVFRNGENECIIDVSSKSNQQYDWGKNEENIRGYFSYIENNINS